MFIFTSIPIDENGQLIEADTITLDIQANDEDDARNKGIEILLKKYLNKSIDNFVTSISNR